MRYSPRPFQIGDVVRDNGCDDTGKKRFAAETWIIEDIYPWNNTVLGRNVHSDVWDIITPSHVVPMPDMKDCPVIQLFPSGVRNV